MSNRVRPSDLRILEKESRFFLSYNDQPLVTPSGVEISHTAPDFLEHMVGEFDGYGSLELDGQTITGPEFLGAYALYSIQKDWVEPAKDDLTIEFEHHVLNDPMLHTVAGPEQAGQIERYTPVYSWLSEYSESLRAYSSRIPFWLGEENYRGEPTKAIEEAKSDKVIKKLKGVYSNLPYERKTVAMMLFAHTKSPLISMTFAMDKCSPSEFATAVMASQMIHADLALDVTDNDHREVFLSLRNGASHCLEYLKYFNVGTPESILRDLLGSAEKETQTQELKSTFRLNLKTGKNDKEITWASLKTIAGFLNTQGGKLIVGVADNGEIVGIEKDGFQNVDKWQLNFSNNISDKLGLTALHSIKTSIFSLPDGTVFVAECSKSDQPIYAKDKNGETHFFIRTGPQTKTVPTDKIFSYVKENFNL